MGYLTADLSSIVSGDAWHGPSWRDVLAGVDARQAALRVLPSAHTIYELVHHTAAWAGEVARRLDGAKASEPAEGDFPPDAASIDDAAWQSVRKRLDDAHEAVIAAIERFDSARLDELVGDERDAPLGSGVSYRTMIAGLLAHSAYHAGQAMQLRRAIEALR